MDEKIEINLQVGKFYKIRDGRIVFIFRGLPPIENKKDGWNGIYFGKFIDGSDNVVPRFLWTGKHWDYISQFSFLGYMVFNDPNKDIVAEVNNDEIESVLPEYFTEVENG
jgi:hypothetical protein